MPEFGRADFDAAIPFVLEHEGGYGDHPADPGGATCWGVSLRLIRDLGYTENERGEIYRRLGAIEASLAVLVERSQMTKDVERECRAELVARLTEHETLLWGNGKVGLVAQVAALERESEERKADRDSLRHWLYGLAALIFGQLLLKIPDMIAMFHRAMG